MESRRITRTAFVTEAAPKRQLDLAYKQLDSLMTVQVPSMQRAGKTHGALAHDSPSFAAATHDDPPASDGHCAPPEHIVRLPETTPHGPDAVVAHGLHVLLTGSHHNPSVASQLESSGVAPGVHVSPFTLAVSHVPFAQRAPFAQTCVMSQCAPGSDGGMQTPPWQNRLLSHCSSAVHGRDSSPRTVQAPHAPLCKQTALVHCESKPHFELFWCEPGNVRHADGGARL
jgi:hypothetical protein